MQKFIPLNVVLARETFDYDPESGVLRRRSTGKAVGTRFDTGHMCVGFDGRMTGVHRIIWAIYYGVSPDDRQIDHINGDGADNRIPNLRLATNAQNSMNSRLSKRNKSGIKGVFWVTKAKVWRAVVGFEKQYYISHHKTIEEAAARVTALRLSLHAEFANDGHSPVGMAVSL
jgi:hypothetical protein